MNLNHYASKKELILFTNLNFEIAKLKSKFFSSTIMDFPLPLLIKKNGNITSIYVYQKFRNHFDIIFIL